MKKNRIDPNSSLRPTSPVAEETASRGTVREVRKGVQELTHEAMATGASAKASKGKGTRGKDATTNKSTTAVPVRAGSISSSSGSAGSGSAEAEGDDSPSTTVEAGLKRKALDRSQSSFAQEGEGVVKRAKDTPSVSASFPLLLPLPLPLPLSIA